MEQQLSSKANFGSFSNLIAQTLGSNSVKDLRVTKVVKVIKLGGVWHELIKKRFPETINQKIFETNSSFHVK